MSAVTKNNSVTAREKPLSKFIPYSTHLASNTIKTYDGDLIRTFALEGAAFETADDDEINTWHEQINILIRNINAPNIALWTHTIRQEENTYPGGEYAPGFAHDLNEKYKASITNARMLSNSLYITVIYRVQPNKTASFFDRFKPTDKNEETRKLKEALEKLDDTSRQVKEALNRYGPRELTTYLRDRAGKRIRPLNADEIERATPEELKTHADIEATGIVYSELSEFLAYLINGEYQHIPLTRTPLNEVLGISRPFFGKETFELRGTTKQRFGASLSIKEYPAITGPGMLDRLLATNAEFILTQSFICLGKGAATGLLTRQRDRLISAGDQAESQIEDIGLALDQLISNEFTYGEHHFVLTVFGPSVRHVNDNLAELRTIVADAGMVVVREDVANEAAFWSQLPCAYKYRTRPAPITSRNFAGFTGFHNYPTGNPKGRWGNAITLLKTSSGAPYRFNFHDTSGLGNTTIIGPSGSGKTVVQGFLISMLQKAKATGVFFDKDRGAEIFIRALRGTYLPLKTGELTGFNPLQLKDTPQNRQFQLALVKQLATANGEPYSTLDEQEAARALDGVYKLPKEQRRLGQYASFLNRTSPGGLFTRLQKWHSNGPMAWAFDNANDTLNMDNGNLFGFDVTEFLDNKEIRTPIILYIFHRMEQLIDGRRFFCFIDEFWKVLEDDAFQDFVQNKLKTIRKQNGFLATGTQSVKDTLRSKIAHSIIEQSPTQIFMPNPKASEEDYVGGFKLSHREYEIIRTLPEASRRFLIRQGANSVVAELNLKGFDNELAVLSGTTAYVEVLSGILRDVGNDPDVWLPIFHQKRKAQ